MIAVITGPLGYILSFLFAWLINELPRWLRTIAVIVFYAPSIAGNVYVIFSIFFRGDAYGYVNAFLMNLGIIDSPILWLTNPDYMLPVCMIVILWMSLGTGFLSFVAGLQGVDRSQFEAVHGWCQKPLAGIVVHYPTKYETDAVIRCDYVNYPGI